MPESRQQLQELIKKTTRYHPPKKNNRHLNKKNGKCNGCNAVIKIKDEDIDPNGSIYKTNIKQKQNRLPLISAVSIHNVKEKCVHANVCVRMPMRACARVYVCASICVQ